MRPVDRGLAQNYLDYYTAPNSYKIQLKETTALRSKLIVINLDISKIENAVRALYPDIKVKRLRLKLPSSKNETLASLRKAQKALQAGYDNAPKSDKRLIVRRAGHLMRNLRLQRQLLNNSYKSYQKKINRLYPKSRADLIANLGQYCSYCEMPLAASLAVEHMVPKKWFPYQSLQWSNFLLACPLCNSSKGDDPSWLSAVKIMNKKTPGLAINEENVLTTAKSLLLWPDDPLYTSVTDAFQFELKRIYYNPAGWEVKVESVSHAVLVTWIRAGILKLHLDDGEQLFASLSPLIGDIASNQQIQDYLMSVGQSKVVPNSQASSSFRTGFEALVSNSDFSASFNSPSWKPEIIRDAANLSWSLTFTANLNVVNKVDYVTFMDKRIDGRTFTSKIVSNLKANILPSEIAETLGVSVFNVHTNVTELSRDSYSVSVTKSYKIQAIQANQLRVFAEFHFPVELHLIAVQPLGGPDLQAKAVRDIEAMALNRRVAFNPKASDRRVLNRTRTFFTICETTKNLSDYLVNGNQGFPNFEHDLIEAIKYTMIQSGFHSIWKYYIEQVITRQDVKTTLLNLLADVQNFPGTRQ